MKLSVSKEIFVHLPHRLSPELQERLLKVAHGCTVHQSLTVSPTVAIELAENSSHQPAGNVA